MRKERAVYNKIRKQLLAEDPYCCHCGVEHCVESPLQYHHAIPQYLNTEEHVGYLLCQQCHARWHAHDRCQHKVIDQSGRYKTSNNPYRPYKQKVKRAQAIERLLYVFQDSN